MEDTFFPTFDAAELGPTDPNVREDDKARLGLQCKIILDALRSGPKTNRQLAGISLKYTGRISDLRKHGFDIYADRKEGGLVVYTLR
jgi:hypothetical protein